jgi:competence protein ComEC
MMSPASGRPNSSSYVRWWGSEREVTNDRAPARLADGAPAGHDPAGWFVRRAGLARFTTFTCALGLALPALTGARPAFAVIGLTTALGGAIVGTALSHRRSTRNRRHLSPRRLRHLLPTGTGVVVLAVLLVGLFAGYLGGSARVAVLLSSALEPRIGSDVRAELVITGLVRSYGGWQSATAVVRSLGAAGLVDSHGTGVSGDIGDPAVGERVLLEVAPDDYASEPAAAGAGAAAVVLSQGMIVAFEGSIEAPEGPSDSGFDQARQLLHQGIKVVLRADGADSIAVLGRRGGVSGWFDRLRASARAHLSRGPSDRVNEVLQGVVMGDTVGIDEGWLDAFRRSGTAHMLSVSGLHVASLAAIMIGLARLVGAARWVGFLLAAASALLIIPFVGSSPPVVRSAVMICIVLTGSWVGRGRDQWQVLGLAAIVVLALNPFAVFDVGFQLSFAAFLGMLVLLAPLQRLLKRLPGGMGSNIAVSIAASLGTAPVALAVFGKTSLVSPLANLLVVPTLPLVTGLGMASVLLGFVWSGLSAALDTLASLPMTWTILVSRLCAVAPVLGAADLGRVLMACALGTVTLPAALALSGRSVRAPLNLPLPFFRRSVAWLRAHRPRDRRRAVALGVAMVLVGLAVGGAAYPSLIGGVETLETLAPGRGWPDEVEVRMLDVGQGNAVLVRTPEHHALLFDGGPADCDLAGQLRALGVRKLDLALVSHPHADHFAGLLEALDALDVEVLVDHVQVVSSAEWVSTTQAGPVESPGGAAEAPSDAGEAGDYLELRHRLADDRCRYVLAVPGQTVTVDDVVVRLFASPKPLILVDGAEPWAALGDEPSGDELNGASLVAVVGIGDIDVLVPGDAEAEVLRRYDLPPAELIVVSHHGSRGAVTDRLLAEWGTQAAFISVGAGNSFGHPDIGTVSLLTKAVGTVLRTDTAGWVSCRVDGDKMIITTERTPTR